LLSNQEMLFVTQASFVVRSANRYMFVTMASPTANTFVIAPDGVAEFSNFVDTVSLSGFTAIQGVKTRMLSGGDIVTLSNVIRGGWDNEINGNLGGDSFFALSGSQTRDLVLGGRDGDNISVSGSSNGADWLNGNRDADTISAGRTTVGSNVLRGGGGNDQLFGGSTMDILVGDFGTDRLRGNGGSDVFMMRTDDGIVDGIVLQNATQNASDVDVIVDYSSGSDKIAIAGIASTSDLVLTQNGGNVLISSSSFTNGTTGTRFIAQVNNTTVATVTNDIVIGNRADNFLASLTPDNFLNNSSLIL